MWNTNSALIFIYILYSYCSVNDNQIVWGETKYFSFCRPEYLYLNSIFELIVVEPNEMPLKWFIQITNLAYISKAEWAIFAPYNDLN